MNKSNSNNSVPAGLTYEAAGVNITAGNTFVERIKSVAKATHRPGVMRGIGGFGALFELPLDRYQQPILVSTTDGVGTKLKIAQACNKHDTIGIDLVAMCVNDIIVQGAEPLFFLDYFATGKLELGIAEQVVAGIGKGCAEAGAALIGGETAEMPGMYHDQDYDLAGFCVGAVEKAKIIDGSRVRSGDVLIGLASSGIHSNGYSLVRKVLEHSAADLNMPFESATLGEALLAPTKIYVKPLLELLKTVDVKAMAHITGGGLVENLPRVLPTFTRAVIQEKSWRWPGIFAWLAEQGNIAAQEMYRTFNCGVGMVLCIAADNVAETLKVLAQQQQQAWVIGQVEADTQAEQPVVVMV